MESGGIAKQAGRLLSKAKAFTSTEQAQKLLAIEIATECKKASYKLGEDYWNKVINKIKSYEKT